MVLQRGSSVRVFREPWVQEDMRYRKRRLSRSTKTRLRERRRVAELLGLRRDLSGGTDNHDPSASEV
jgi:hypothetical protein